MAADVELYETLQEASFARSSKATAESLDRRMTGEAIRDFLVERRYAAVATTRADGRPHVAMTGYLAHAGLVWLPVMAGTGRVRNVAAQPYAAVVVAEGEGDEHVMVTLEGPATVVESVPDDVRAVWQRQIGSDPTWAVAWIRVEVTTLFSYAAPGSGRGST